MHARERCHFFAVFAISNPWEAFFIVYLREGDCPDDGLYFITKGRVEVLVGGGGDSECGLEGRGADYVAQTRYFAFPIAFP